VRHTSGEKEAVMSNNALSKARDLPRNVRHALEILLGRPLQEEETVSVQTFPTHEAPTGTKREEAWKRLMDRIDRTAARAKEIPEAELDALIDEATRYVRHHAA
jgi:molecular chaperone DnaK (HSP70)